MVRGRSIAEEINSKVNIVELISCYVDLKKTGKNFKGLCPFHNEKTPSFTVSDERGRYYCFGCKATGDVINFIMDIEHLDFIEAVKLLSDRYSIDISEFRGDGADKDVRNEMLGLAREVANFYYKKLKSSVRGSDYLERRGISQDTVKKFGIGYADESWDSLASFFYGRSSEQFDNLRRLGLLSRKKGNKTYFDVYRDRIIFPIQNIQGKVIGFGGRNISDLQPKYLNSPESLIFDKGGILYGLNNAKNTPESKRSIIVVEGYMDAIMLSQAGFYSTVATLGTSFTANHAQTLARYTREIILCYDGDAAGINAAVRAVGILKNVNCTVKVLILPDGLDPDEFIKANGISEFRTLLSEASNLFSFYLKTLFNKYNDMGENGVIKVISDYLSFISYIDSPTERELQMKKLSAETGISIDAIREEMKKTAFLKSKRPQRSMNTYGKGEESIDVILEEERRNRIDEPKIHSFKAIKRELGDNMNKKLYDVELRILQIALSSAKNASLIFKDIRISTIRNEGIKRAVISLLEYYENIGDEYTALKAVEILELELARRLEKQKDTMPDIDNIDNEIKIIIHNHKLLLIQIELDEIKKLRNKYENIGSRDSEKPGDRSTVIGDGDFTHKIDALNRREVELRGVLANLGALNI